MYDAHEDYVRLMQMATSPVERTLLRLNGGVVNDSIGSGRRVTAVLEDLGTPQERVRWLFLAALSREPTASESRQFVEYARGAEDEWEATSDLLWSLLNSTEFGVVR